MANEGPNIVGDFSTPDFFSDDAILFDLSQGTVRVTFGVVRNEVPIAGNPQALVAIGRLIMPIAGAQRLALGLFDYLKKQGLDPTSQLGSLDEKKPH